MYLAQVSITTAGVITVTDEREFLNEGMHPRAIAVNTSPNINSGAALAKYLMNTAVASKNITHDTANNRFTAVYPGLYMFSFGVNGVPVGTTGYLTFTAYKNGAPYQSVGFPAGFVLNVNNPRGSCTVLIPLVTADYVEVWYNGTTLAGGAGPWAFSGLFSIARLSRGSL